MGWLRFLTLGVGLVLLIQNVNSSAICVEKFVDGEDNTTRYEYVVGERITLRCDVSARNPATHVVYWKHDSLVFSQEDHVIEAHQAKYNVSLENNIYTISWIAELDDAGKYNCTCSTGGLQFLVWIKVPCNELNKVINDTTASNGTSPEVLDYLYNGTIPELKEGESLNFSVALDCGCTWPEVNRTFIGRWDTDGIGKQFQQIVLPENATGTQNNSKKPYGCATKHSVTYRYKDVYGRFDSVDFTCNKAKGMLHRKFAFYIDEGESKIPEPIMKIQCGPIRTTDEPPCDRPCDCPCIPAVEITLGVTGAVTLICIVIAIVTDRHTEDAKPQRFTKKDVFITLSIVEIIALICVIAVFCWCIQLCELCSCEMFPSLGHIIGFVIVLIVTTAVIIFCIVRIYMSNKGTEPQKNEGHDNNGFKNKLADRNILPSQPNDIKNKQIPLSVQQPRVKSCVTCRKNPVQVYFKTCGHAAVCNSCAKIMQAKAENVKACCPVCRKLVTDFPKLCMICLENPVQVYFKPCGHAAVCKSCAKSMSDKAENPAYCPECSEVVKNTQKLCMICSENPVQVYFKPCRDAAACTICAIDIIRESSKESWPALCPECKEEVTDYQNMICLTCSKNPIQVCFKPCGHANICNSCTRRSDKNTSPHCQCGEPIRDFEKVCMVCFEKPVLAHLTPCNHKVVCQPCADDMKKKSVTYCPTCDKKVQDYTF